MYNLIYWVHCNQLIKDLVVPKHGMCGRVQYNGQLMMTWVSNTPSQNSQFILYTTRKSILLSLQSWGEAHTGQDKDGGARTTMVALEYKFCWNKQQNSKTIPTNVHGNNIATFQLAT